MGHKYTEGLGFGTDEPFRIREGGPQEFEPTADRMIALSKARSLHRIADVLEWGKNVLQSPQSRAFFEKLLNHPPSV